MHLQGYLDSPTWRNIALQMERGSDWYPSSIYIHEVIIVSTILDVGKANLFTVQSIRIHRKCHFRPRNHGGTDCSVITALTFSLALKFDQFVMQPVKDKNVNSIPPT